MEEKTIAELKQIYWGIQDEAMKKLNGRRITYDSIIEAKQFNLTGNVTHKVQFPNKTSGISNVRIEGDWETIELQVGCLRIDKLFKINCENTFDIFNNGCYLPFLEHFTIMFVITGNNYTLNYDIVNVNLDESIEYNDIFVKVQGYTGTEALAIGNNDIRLNFHQPVEKITVRTDNKVENLELVIDNKYKLPLIQVDDLKWELNFGDMALNFSRMDRVRLLFNNSYENNHINTCVINQNIMRILNGMAGLYFSK